MVLQVGAVRHKLPDAQREDRDALSHVEQAGRSALSEMRRLLDAMRGDGDDADLAPQPGLDRVEALIGEVGRAGLPVHLHVEGEPFALPRGVDISAYRIIQEGLTNALKHANAHRADVAQYTPDQLTSRCATTATASSSWRQRRRLRPGRDPRARQALRRRDVRRIGARRWICPYHPPAGDGVYAMTIRVLVADDQSMVRAGFRMLLSGEDDIEVVAEAQNGLEAVDKAARFEPTVVLMDIRMPELDGLQATRRILATDPAARILVLTTFGLDEYVFEALSAGASGFVLKDDPPAQLDCRGPDRRGRRCTAVAGDHHQRVISQFTRTARAEPPEGLDELTSREREILRLIATGLSNAEIGAELSSPTPRSRPTSPTSCRSSTSATACRRS